MAMLEEFGFSAPHGMPSSKQYVGTFPSTRLLFVLSSVPEGARNCLVRSGLLPRVASLKF